MTLEELPVDELLYMYRNAIKGYLNSAGEEHNIADLVEVVDLECEIIRRIGKL